MTAFAGILLEMPRKFTPAFRLQSLEIFSRENRRFDGTEEKRFVTDNL
jgi:hypothetical protein